ncbi:MAG: hypothetical protein RBU23_07625 [Candidatus Auribacterota bacterium]|nr:hypothetical protein [Candidatus Auribacterota bacterium]
MSLKVIFILIFLIICANNVYSANFLESKSISMILDYNDTPIISNISTSGYTREVTVTYDLSHPLGAPCNIRVEFMDGSEGSTWSPITATDSSALEAVYPGQGLSFIWDSVIDIPDANGEGYWLRISAVDGYLEGQWEYYGPFPVPHTPVRFVSIEKYGFWIKLKWYAEQGISYKLYWANDLNNPIVWDEVNYPGFHDHILLESENIHSWIDYGDDPEMDNDSYDANIRMYKITF